MKFSDLHLRVPLDDCEKARSLIAKSSELGYNQVGVPFHANVKRDVVDRLRQTCEEFGLDLVTRLELWPRSSSELLGGLRRFRRSFEIVSVLCGSKPVARQAAKDRRVDLLSFPTLESKKVFFDRAEAELASKSSAALEIDMAQVLSSEEISRVGVLSRLRREVTMAKRFHVPIVLCSGTADNLLLRKPQDFASLTFLFDMDASLALEALSNNPLRIVGRSRVKQSSDFVAPGVRIVRRKKVAD